MFVPLRVESLESRDVPATFGTPWPDGQHLTLSFAPDGTSIGGTQSNLTSALSAHDPSARLAVLRAFQTWALASNVNIGLVSDSGAAFGTGGAVQGDPRFGDIRVGGRPLGSDVLAITAPYNLYDNYSGDIVLNTAANFGAGGSDLYTAMLQEAGHALGIGNNADVTSAMFEFYQGPRTGLSAADGAALRALYGARQADTYEGASGNNTLDTATTYPKLKGPVTADLTTATDVDVYTLTAKALTDRVAVSLRARGLSLVTARLELLDAAGRVLASGGAADPMNNDITLPLGSISAGQTYFVRVSGARADEFSVGSYELEVKQVSLVSTLTDGVGNLLDDTGLNDTLFTATTLLTDGPSIGPHTEYSVSASFASVRDADVYRVKVPDSQSGAPVNLLLTVWGADGRAIDPWMEVADARGRKLDAEVIAADGNTTTLQVRGLQPGQKYFVRTFSDTKSVGGYHFAADLRTEVASVPELASGSLNSDSPTSESFTLAQSGQVHLVLSATGATGAAEAVVTDASGREVRRFAANAGRGRSLDLMLGTGTYTVTLRSTSGALNFRLGVAIVTDPVGARPEDPTTAPVPTAPPPPAPEQPVAQPTQPPTASQPDAPMAPPPSEPQPEEPPPTAEPSEPAPQPSEPPQPIETPQGTGESEPMPTGTTAPEESDESVWWY